MCLGNLSPNSARTSSSLLRTWLFAAAKPFKSGTVSISQTMTLLMWHIQQAAQNPASAHLAPSRAATLDVIRCRHDSKRHGECFKVALTATHFISFRCTQLEKDLRALGLAYQVNGFVVVLRN